MKRAFGRFWGFSNGWLSWSYSLIDMALYPVLFLQYVRFFAPGLGIGVSQSTWNYSGWDNASTIGGEIEHASATYPRALARTLPLVTGVYLLTIIPVLALTDWTTWSDGAWPRLPRRSPGRGSGGGSRWRGWSARSPGRTRGARRATPCWCPVGYATVLGRRVRGKSEVPV